MRRPGFHGLAPLAALLALLPSAGVRADDLPLAERVKRAAVRAAAELVEPPDRFEVDDVRFTGAADAPDGSYRLELADVSGPNASGRVRMRFAMVVAGVPRGDAWALLNGRVRGPALVAAKTLRGGEEIDTGDVEVVESDLTRVRTTPLREAEEIQDVVPVRSLGTGRILTRDLVRPAPLVRRGETADLYLRRPGLVVAVPALVRADGAAGETVPVDSVSSGARLLARVESDGSLTVVRGALEKETPMTRQLSMGIASVVVLLALVAPGCAVRTTRAEPTLHDDVGHLLENLDYLPPFPIPQSGSGSLWTEGGPAAAMFRDPKAFRVNDLVTIVLEERSLGSNESTTDLNRSSEASVGADVAFGFEKADPQAGKFNLNQVLGSSTDTSFAGDGRTTRSSRLSATITGRVLRVLPNGDLVVAGQKTVVVNRERQVLTLVGSVRPVDLTAGNRIASSSVGELTVRLWGRGEIDATVRQGWFMRVLNRVWPF